MTTTQIENMVRTMCPTFSESQLAIAQRIEPVSHDRHYKAVGLLEIPARVGMLVAEVQQLRDAINITHQPRP